MDISKIDDPKELKAIAYDQLALKQQIEQNLINIDRRLQELAQRDVVESKK